MKGWIKPTEENVGDYFDGVMIPVRDPICGDHQVPGWKCKSCGWTIGARLLPPAHHCDPRQKETPMPRDPAPESAPLTEAAPDLHAEKIDKWTAQRVRNLVDAGIIQTDAQCERVFDVLGAAAYYGVILEGERRVSAAKAQAARVRHEQGTLQLIYDHIQRRVDEGSDAQGDVEIANSLRRVLDDRSAEEREAA